MCKRCKSHQVQLRAYERKGRMDVIEAWRASGMAYIQDFTARRARRDRLLRVSVRRQRRVRVVPLEVGRARVAGVAALLWWATNNVAELEQATADDRARRYQEYRRADAAKKREKRLLDPEGMRAKARRQPSRAPARQKEYGAHRQARRRARIGAVVKTFPLNLVWDAHKGLCGICSDPCDTDWWHLDHVVPLALGGSHTIENVAPAHPYCNMVKGSKTNDMLNVDWLRRTRPDWESGEVGKRMRERRSAPCGTEQRYHRGCRCRACKDAHNAAARRRRGTA